MAGDTLLWNFFVLDHQARLTSVKLISAFSLLKVRYLFALLVFLQKFTALENNLCMLFANNARRQLHDIFMQFGSNIKTVCQLRNAIYTNFLTTISAR